MKALRQCKKGTTTWEFALVLFISLPLCVGFLYVMGSHVHGSYVQYATYMASRTYLSANSGESENDRRDRVIRVFEQYMDRLPPGIRKYGAPLAGLENGGLEFDADRRLPMVKYRFQTRILPAMFGAFGEAFETEAESFLGKDPSQEDCAAAMSAGTFQKHWDNGC